MLDLNFEQQQSEGLAEEVECGGFANQAKCS